MARWKGPLMLLLFVAACAGPAGDTTLTYVPVRPPILAKSMMSAMISSDRAVAAGALEEGAVGERYPVEAVELLREAELGREWSGARLHRALAVGHPASVCPYHSVAVAQPTVARASSFAMQVCVRYINRLAAATGQDCSCRLAALDNALLMSPAELRYTNEMPALVARQSDGDEQIWGGMLKISGRTGEAQAISMRSLDGSLQCLGTYESTTPLQGSFVLRCDEQVGADPLRGRFRVLRIHQGNNVGIAAASNSRGTILAVFGLDERGFRERLAELGSSPSRMGLILSSDGS